jgi:hypothetical protein
MNALLKIRLILIKDHLRPRLFGENTSRLLMKKSSSPSQELLVSRASGLAFLRCSEAGMKITAEEIADLLTNLGSHRSGREGIADPSPSLLSLKVFFSPTSSGNFIPCDPTAGSSPSDYHSSQKTWQSLPSPILMGKGVGESSLLLEKNTTRVVIHWNESAQFARVLNFASFSPSDQGTWLRQNTPSGLPAEVSVLEKPPTSPAETNPQFMIKESFYSHGQLWDPSEHVPAETCYYPNGQVYWHRRYRGGTCRSIAARPCLQVFWPSGSPQIVEYGREGVGKHRPLHLGPAYQEFYTSGKPALVMFAEDGKMKSCQWFDDKGHSVEAGVSAQDIVPSNSLVLPRDILMEFDVSPPALSMMWTDDIIPLNERGKPLPAPAAMVPQNTPVRRSSVRPVASARLDNRTRGR